jgi:hypothetical protein
LEQLREGEPVLLFDEAGVPVLIRAMAGGYHIDEKTRKIVKDGTYDHPADGYRYLVTGEFGSPPTDAAVDVSLPKTLEYNAAMDPQLSNYVRTNR